MKKGTKKSAAEQMVDQNQLQRQVDTTNTLTAILARDEAINIIINLLNEVFAVTQQGNLKIGDPIIEAIQRGIDAENDKTKALYAKLQQLMNSEQSAAQTEEGGN